MGTDLAAGIQALEGTDAGRHLALALAIMAAVLHAVFGALQKGRFDPWLTRGAIDGAYGLMALPVALFVVPWPQGHQWLLFLGAWIIHTVYKLLQAAAYSRGAYTVVYPVVRGTGPLFAVIGAYVIFGERFAPMQWMGVMILLGGIFGLAAFNMRYLTAGRDTLIPALLLAFLTGLCVALYTTYDAFGIRATPNPFTFLAWFFMIDGITFPVLAMMRYRKLAQKPDLPSLLRRGVLGGVIAFASFGGIMMATRLDKVGEAAVMRETSAVFAALIGWLVLRETVGPVRMVLIALIAIGAIIVELGG